MKDLHQISDQLLHEMLIPKLGSTFAIKSLVCELFQYLDPREYYHISNVTLKLVKIIEEIILLMNRN